MLTILRRTANNKSILPIIRTFTSSPETMAHINRVSHVGSWLRPSTLKEERAQFFQGKLDADKLKESEDKYIKTVVAEQQKAGLKVGSSSICYCVKLGAKI